MAKFLVLIALLLAFCVTIDAYAHLQCAIRSTPSSPLLFSREVCEYTSNNIPCIGSSTYTVQRHVQCVDDQDGVTIYPPSQYSAACQATLSSIRTMLTCTIPNPKATLTATVSDIAIYNVFRNETYLPVDIKLIYTSTTPLVLTFHYTGSSHAIVDIYLNSISTGSWTTIYTSFTAGRTNGTIALPIILPDSIDFSIPAKYLRRDNLNLSFGISVRSPTTAVGGKYLTRLPSTEVVIWPFCHKLDANLCNGQGKCVNSYDTQCTCDADYSAVVTANPDFFDAAATRSCACPFGYAMGSNKCSMVPICPTDTSFECFNHGAVEFESGSCQSQCMCNPGQAFAGPRCDKCNLLCGNPSQVSVFDEYVYNQSKINGDCTKCECSLGFAGPSCRCDAIKSVIKFKQDLNDTSEITLSLLKTDFAQILKLSLSQFELDLFTTTFPDEDTTINAPYNFTIKAGEIKSTIAVITIPACQPDINPVAADFISPVIKKSDEIEEEVFDHFSFLSATDSVIENDLSPKFLQAHTASVLTIENLSTSATIAHQMGGVDTIFSSCTAVDCNDVSVRILDPIDNTDLGKLSRNAIGYQIASIVIVAGLCVIALFFIIIVVAHGKASANATTMHSQKKLAATAPVPTTEMIAIAVEDAVEDSVENEQPKPKLATRGAPPPARVKKEELKNEESKKEELKIEEPEQEEPNKEPKIEEPKIEEPIVVVEEKIEKPVIIEEKKEETKDEKNDIAAIQNSSSFVIRQMVQTITEDSDDYDEQPVKLGGYSRDSNLIRDDSLLESEEIIQDDAVLVVCFNPDKKSNSINLHTSSASNHSNSRRKQRQQDSDLDLYNTDH